MNRLVRNPIAMALLVLVTVVAIRFGMAAGGEVAPPRTTGIAGVPTSEAPSAENVSHDFRRRVAELERMLEAEPADTSALRELAAMRFDAHDLAEASTLYRRYVESVPEDRQAWLDLATALGGLEDWAGAAESMLAMLDHFPDDASAMYNLGAIEANRGNRTEAAAWWHRVVQSPDSAMAAAARTSLAKLAGS